jgi:hypothetical protein
MCSGYFWIWAQDTINAYTISNISAICTYLHVKETLGGHTPRAASIRSAVLGRKMSIPPDEKGKRIQCRDWRQYKMRLYYT